MAFKPICKKICTTQHINSCDGVMYFILGIIQNDYDILLDNVSSEVFVTSIFPAFKEYEQLFSYVVEGAFKAESLTHNFEVAMEAIIKQLLKDSHGCQPLRCAVIFLNIFNKVGIIKLKIKISVCKKLYFSSRSTNFRLKLKIRCYCTKMTFVLVYCID